MDEREDLVGAREVENTIQAMREDQRGVQSQMSGSSFNNGNDNHSNNSAGVD